MTWKQTCGGDKLHDMASRGHRNPSLGGAYEFPLKPLKTIRYSLQARICRSKWYSLTWTMQGQPYSRSNDGFAAKECVSEKTSHCCRLDHPQPCISCPRPSTGWSSSYESRPGRRCGVERFWRSWIPGHLPESARGGSSNITGRAENPGETSMAQEITVGGEGGKIGGRLP